MGANFTVVYNLLVPGVTGFFFLLYFVYFVIANPSKAMSYRLFVIFLASFSFFILGRPLQLIAGPHPLPLIIVNLRVFVLCAVIAPVVMLTANVFGKNRLRHKESLIVIGGVALGLVYVIFNTLGTQASFTLWSGGSLILRDNLTPSLLAPWYAREVTLAVQVVVGCILLAFSFEKLARLKIENLGSPIAGNKNVYINGGILIFALSFIAGSLLRQWWVYYAASVASALLIGASVLMDIREIHTDYEKLVPFLTDDLVRNFAFKDMSKIRMKEMFRMMGKSIGMDTFAIVKIDDGGSNLEESLSQLEAVTDLAKKTLLGTFQEESYVVFPVSENRIGVILSVHKALKTSTGTVLEVFEDLNSRIEQRFNCRAKTGIGRTYPKTDDLCLSYREALNAQQYAEQVADCSVIHADNVGARMLPQGKYPVREKEKLLASVRLGDLKESLENLKAFMDGFQVFILENPEALKARLYELSGSLIDAAILGGGDEQKLNDLVNRHFQDIHGIKDANAARAWLERIIRDIAENIGKSYDTRSKLIIENAKRYIQEHFGEQIGYKDAAKEIFISPSYFLGLFKKETGMTFTDYLTETRLNKARELLTFSDKTITEIAYEIGYNNSNYFSSLFAKAAGISPSDYRKAKTPH